MKDTSEAAPQLLTIPQVAARLGLHRVTVYRMLNAGDLASVKVGGSRRVSESALAEYVKALTP